MPNCENLLAMRQYEGDYYLTSNHKEGATYFRQGSTILHDRSPTFFSNAHEAYIAAYEMGFSVHPYQNA